ncbi:MAG: T9SS type A sorting domain-containing protein [Saprospiraceae bacterium]|nr:T9SS type A sorting domain-containing protein [Saprospiraceae bacterium]
MDPAKNYAAVPHSRLTIGKQPDFRKANILRALILIFTWHVWFPCGMNGEPIPERHLNISSTARCRDMVTNTWTGLVDSNWFVAGNWDQNQVPTSDDEVVINNGHTVLINAGDAVAASVTLDNGDYSHLYIASGASLTAATVNLPNGRLMGMGTVNGNVVTSGGGNVEPGNPLSNQVGTLTINGDFIQDDSNGSGGYLNIMIQGLTTHSTLMISGTAQLSGHLNLFINNFSVNVGDAVHFLHSATVVNSFSNVSPNTWPITYNDPATGDLTATYSPPPPPNDHCEQAITLMAGYSQSAYTTNAVNEVDPAPSCYGNGSYDIWYSLTAPSSGNVLIGQINPEFVQSLVLYSGSCGSLTEVACRATNYQSNSCEQILATGLTPNDVYYVQLITDAEESAIWIYYENPDGPPNNFCPEAIDISVNGLGECPSGNVSTNTDGAVHTTDISCANQYQCNYRNLWYRFTSPASGLVRFLQGSGNPLATFFSGSMCNSLNQEACVTGTGTVQVPPDETIYLLISVYVDNPSNNVDFDFCLEEAPDPPTNNTCSGAIETTISANGNCSQVTGTTENATLSRPFSCIFDPNEQYVDVWYSFAGPAGGDVTFHSGTGQPFAVVFSGTCPGSLSEVANGCIRGSGTVGGLAEGQTYYLQILTSGSDGSDFDFCLEIPDPAPGNDNCTGALSASLGNPLVISSLYARTSMLPSCAPVPSLNIPDLWYSFVAPANGEVGYFFEFGAGLLPLTIYSGTCATLDEVYCAIPLQDPSPFDLFAGNTYFAQVSSVGAVNNFQAYLYAPGDFTFTGATGTSFQSNENWKSGSVPASGNDVLIPAGAGTCTLEDDFTSTASLIVESGATLSIESGVTLDYSGGQFSCNGTLSGQGVFTGALVNDGTIRPGDSPGILSIQGSFTNQGIIEFELGGIVPGTGYDQISVSGDIYLDGTAMITLYNGFIPSGPNSFIILESTSGTVNGTFSTVQFPVIPGITWEILYHSDHVEVLASGSPLPVELADFKATLLPEGEVLLRWRTYSESGNEGWEIQRSSDVSSWMNIGFVPGKNTFIQPFDYQFIDRNPGKSWQYYRMKQMDMDGTVSFSPIVTVDVGLLDVVNGAIPNPAIGMTILKFIAYTPGDRNITLMDVRGTVLHTVTIPVHEPGEIRTQLNLSAFVPGVYLICLSDPYARSQVIQLIVPE